MKWFLALVFVLSAACQAAETNRLPDEVMAAMSTARHAVLYSIEPYSPEGAALDYYGYKSLGKVRLSAGDARAAIDAFRDAVMLNSSDDGAACFDPRHALQLKSGGHQYDLLLCYECGAMRIYRDGVELASLYAGGSSSKLDDMLKHARIPLAWRLR